MLVPFTCKKCGGEFKMDVEDRTPVEVEEILKRRDGFECPGHHVEFGSPLDYWTLHWDRIEEGQAPDDDAVLSQLKEKFKYVLTTQDLQRDWENVSFAFGMCIATNKETKDVIAFEFTNLPTKRGERIYYA